MGNLESDLRFGGGKTPIPISSLSLTVRTRNALEKLNILTLNQLAEFSETQLLQLKNFGWESLNELIKLIRKYGLKFGSARTNSENAHIQLTDQQIALLVRPISVLNLSVRSAGCLKKLNVETVAGTKGGDGAVQYDSRVGSHAYFLRNQ